MICDDDKARELADESEYQPCDDCGETLCVCDDDADDEHEAGDGAGWLVTEDELRAYEDEYDDPSMPSEYDRPLSPGWDVERQRMFAVAAGRKQHADAMIAARAEQMKQEYANRSNAA